MRTKTFTLMMIATLIVASVNVSAKVWRVNPTPNSSAHYSTAQAAHNAATTLNNDTLYIEGSTLAVGGLSLSKKLTIIGTGYFLTENPETQYYKYISPFDSYVYCSAGSEGSKFIGCTFSYSIYVNVNNITLERNYFYSSYSIYPQVNCSNIIIRNNYFGYSGYCLNFGYTHSNILVSNNYFAGSISTSATFSGFFINNIFGNTISINNSTLVNNIALSSVTLSNCIATYNIGHSTQFGTLNGNQQNVPASILFVGLAGNSTDGQWKLKSGSPAIGAGEGGTDIGMFGGEYPYKLSGLPPIPAIYDLDAQSLPSNTLDVNLKAKSHN